MDSIFDMPELNSIELLGYAKNNVIEAKEKASNLPMEYKDKWNNAYSLLHEVQEYALQVRPEWSS